MWLHGSNPFKLSPLISFNFWYDFNVSVKIIPVMLIVVHYFVVNINLTAFVTRLVSGSLLS